MAGLETAGRLTPSRHAETQGLFDAARINSAIGGSRRRGAAAREALGGEQSFAGSGARLLKGQ